MKEDYLVPVPPFSAKGEDAWNVGGKPVMTLDLPIQAKQWFRSRIFVRSDRDLADVQEVLGHAGTRHSSAWQATPLSGKLGKDGWFEVSSAEMRAGENDGLGNIRQSSGTLNEVASDLRARLRQFPGFYGVRAQIQQVPVEATVPKPDRSTYGF